MLFFLDVLPGSVLSSACQRVVKSSILDVVDDVVVVASFGAWQPCVFLMDAFHQISAFHSLFLLICLADGLPAR
jgi:hypothetical protein